jgi:hypothetical protein
MNYNANNFRGHISVEVFRNCSGYKSTLPEELKSAAKSIIKRKGITARYDGKTYEILCPVYLQNGHVCIGACNQQSCLELFCSSEPEKCATANKGLNKKLGNGQRAKIYPKDKA